MISNEKALGPDGSGRTSDANAAIVSEFSSILAHYDGFRLQAENLVRLLASARGINCTLESRVKTLKSLELKLETKSYERLLDVPDLAGVRIIVRYLSDVPQLIEMLSREFVIVSSDSHEFESPNTFGYVSHHLIVRLSEARSCLGEWRVYDGLACEVQIRTILQHAWATISHSLDYKFEDEMPVRVRRELFKVAALLESGDEMFERYRLAVLELQQNYAESTNWRSLPLDLDAVKTHADKFDLSKYFEALTKAGCKPTCKFDDRHLSRAIQCAKFLGMSSLAEIESFLETASTVDGVIFGISKHSDSTKLNLEYGHIIFLALYWDPRIGAEEMKSLFPDLRESLDAQGPNLRD